MITEVFMPKNGMDMQEGTIIRWLKEVGDPVVLDEPIMEIETDKIAMEAEAPATGILLKKLYNDGDVVPVLTVIGYIGEAGDSIPESSAKAEVQEGQEAVKETAPAVSNSPSLNNTIAATPYAKTLARKKGVQLSAVSATGRHGEVTGRDVEAAATPVAKKVAADLGVDLSTVTGNGYNGKITKQDVVAATGRVEETKPMERQRMTAMRRTIAQRMSASHTEIPPVTQNTKIDVTELLEIRELLNKGRDKSERISINDFVIAAVARAIIEFPRVRMRIENDEYARTDDIDIGVAVGLDDGLIVPVIRSAHLLRLGEIASESKRLAQKARASTLDRFDFGGACITISNLGMYGIHSFTPIVNQPESAIIGVCEVEDELALDNKGGVCVRKKMIISVTYDHRILNGAEAAQFALRIRDLMEHPYKILT